MAGFPQRPVRQTDTPACANEQMMTAGPVSSRGLTGPRSLGTDVFTVARVCSMAAPVQTAHGTVGCSDFTPVVTREPVRSSSQPHMASGPSAQDALVASDPAAPQDLAPSKPRSDAASSFHLSSVPRCPSPAWGHFIVHPASVLKSL